MYHVTFSLCNMLYNHLYLILYSTVFLLLGCYDYGLILVHL